MPDGGVVLPSVQSDVDPHRLALWRLPRHEAEDIYAEAYARNDREALRWLGRNDRYFLLTCLLRRPDARSDWLYARCREVEADPNDHLDLWAREHYKSTIITFAGIIQEILRDQEISVGIFAHNRGIAKGFLRQIKQEFEDNAELKALYSDILWEDPKRQSPKWSEDDGIVVIRKSNPKEASVEAWGLVDGMPTGKHFKLRVYDDVVTEKSVTTPDMIKKTTDMFDLSENLGARGGHQWLIGTRYHYGDTYGIVISRGIVKERRYPATHDGTFEGRPVFLTDAEWQRKLKQPKPVVAAQQLLNPLAGTDKRFDLKWLKYWDVRPKRLMVYIIGDPSKGRTEKSDFTSIVAIGIDINRNKYLLDAVRHRMPLSKRWQTLRDMWKRWSRMPGVTGVLVGYEQYGLQTDLEYFEERMEIEQISFSVEELNWTREGNESKQYRIERLEPDFRSGRLRMPHVVEVDEEGRITDYDPRKKKAAQEAIAAGETWRIAQPLHKIDEDGKVYDVMSGFVEEYMFFPVAPHDDMLDAMSRIYDMNPSVPVYYEQEPGQAMSVEPEEFVDGV